MIGIIIFVLAATGLGTGVAAFLVHSRTSATICQAISRLAFATNFLLFTLIVVPKMREVFIGFGVEVQWFTAIMLNGLNWNAWQSVLFTVMTIFAALADVVLFGLLQTVPSTRRWAQWISLAITICLISMPIIINAALYAPIVKGLNDLS